MTSAVASRGEPLSLLSPPDIDVHPRALLGLGILDGALGLACAGLGWLVFPLQHAIALPSSLGVPEPVVLGTALWVLVCLAASMLLPSNRLVLCTGSVVGAGLLGGPVAGAWVGLLGTFDRRELRGEVPWYGVLANHGQMGWAGFATSLLMLGARAIPGGQVYQLLDFGVVLVGALVFALLNEGMSALTYHARTGVPPGEAFGYVRRRDWNATVVAEACVAFLAALAYWGGAWWSPALIVVVDAAMAYQMRHQRSTWELRHNPKTELPNAIGLREHAAELARSVPPPSSAVLMYFDLDRFKQVNDTFGHDAGDEVLRAIGAGLAEVSRPEAFVAHLHGDEFALLLTDVAEADCDRVSEEVRTVVQRSVPRPYADSVPVSATVGHARVDDLRDLGPATAEADRRMLAKKEARRVAEGRERRVG